MKLYIRLKNVPELKDLPAPKRSLVHRLCYQQFAGSAWQIWVANLLLGICGGFGLVAGKAAYRFTDIPLLPAIVVGTLAGAAIGFVVFRQIVISHLRPFYAQFVNEITRQQDVKH